MTKQLPFVQRLFTLIVEENHYYNKKNINKL